MKKTAIVLVIGSFVIISASCFYALAGPPGPPPGPVHHGGGLHAGPPGPPQGPPPLGAELLGGPPGPPLGPPPHGGFPGLWNAPPDLIEELKLTADQLKQIRLTYVDFKDRTRKARTALMSLRDEKQTMMLYGKIDLAKLAKVDDETVKLASEVMGEELKMKREQLSKLTPEQQERLAEFLSKRKPPHGPKMMPR